ncbi:Transmembrane osmosensor [Tulasnella sp. 425]|nr:Transmembrane osmosensor [Tulasnella sp. 425]
MPPRGNGGLDFTPLVTHFVFLFTFVIAFAGWWAAFIGQAIATARFGDFGGGVGTLWFAIFLELALILGVAYTLASDTIGMHRLQLAAFLAVALVFSVNGTNGLFSRDMAQQAYGAGWLLMTIDNLIWLLYFTAEEDSLVFHLINKAGGGPGGLTPPSRHRRRNPSVHSGGVGGGPMRNSSMNGPYNSSIGPGYGGNVPAYGSNGPAYGGNTLSGGGIPSVAFDDGNKAEHGLSSGTPKAGSFVAGGAAAADTRSNRSTNAPASVQGNQSPRTPLMSAAIASIGSTGVGDPDSSGQGLTSGVEPTGYAYRARALYAYNASPDDPNEISFAKGETLEIVDNSGKWWQARKQDGTTGNYLQII